MRMFTTQLLFATVQWSSETEHKNLPTHHRTKKCLFYEADLFQRNVVPSMFKLGCSVQQKRMMRGKQGKKKSSN